MNAATVTRWMTELRRDFAEQRDYLTQLDAAIGDADHGANMTRGFTAVEAKLDGLDGGTPPGKLLVPAGSTLVSTVGGASGPLWGSALRRAGKALGDADDDRARRQLVDALDAAVAGVVELGAAEPGDKTMVDALGPAVDALRALARRRAHRSAERRRRRPRGGRGGHARDRADAGPQGPGVVSRRALDRPPGSRRDLGRAHRGRARAGGRSGAMSAADAPRPPGLAGCRARAAPGPAAARSRPTAGTPERGERARHRRASSWRGASWPTLATALRADGHAADAEIVETNRMMATDRTLVDAAMAARRRRACRAPRRSRARPSRTRGRWPARRPDAGRARRRPARRSRAAPASSRSGLAGRAAGRRDRGGRRPRPGRGRRVGRPDRRRSCWPAAAPRRTPRSWRARWASRWSPAAGEPVLAIPVGEEIGVDADRGLVWRRPDAATRDAARGAHRAAPPPGGRARPGGAPSSRRSTTDGRVAAAAGQRRHARRRSTAALEAGAEGIGLLRSELAFLDAPALADRGRSTRRRWSRCCAPLADRIATVRTLDFGGDKTPPFLAEHGRRRPARRRAASGSRWRADDGVDAAAARAPARRGRRGAADPGADGDRGGRGRRRARARARAPATPSRPARPTRWSAR